ncbi:MAG TPA: HAD family phosphatase [Caproicibacter sp.]|nr:HAD family phosphatase [Caproicibacter sp.]
MIQAVIFDMDGLMFNTEQLTKDIWDELGKGLGYENVSAVMPETMGVRLDLSAGIFKRHFGDDFPHAKFIEEYRVRFDEKLKSEGVPVKPGLFELLDYLKKEGYICAVASSTSRKRVMRYFEETGVTGYFKKIICGDMVEKSKPDPQIYLTAATEIGVEPKDCMVLEDSPNGCLAAYRAGMAAVMVPDQVQPDEKLQSMLFARVDSLKDVIPLLERIRNGKA